jgi:N-acetylneuraminic acid mutarotase
MDINSFALGYSAGRKKGGSGGGGAELNIAYGDTPPEDTSKLWVKKGEFEDMQIVPAIPGGGSNSVKTLEAKLPYAFLPVVGSVGSKIYVAKPSGDAPTEMYEFDAKTHTITEVSVNFAKSAGSMTSASVGTKIYYFGGYAGGVLNAYAFVFDSETKKFSKLSSISDAKLAYMSSAVLGTKVYLFGGYNGSASQAFIEVFDTETNACERLSTSLPQGRRKMASAVVGTDVYLFGGVYGTTAVNTIFKFDSVTKQITTLDTTLPTNLCSMASAVIGGKVYLFGGSNKDSSITSGNLYNTIHVFDPETLSFTTLNETLPAAMYNFGTAAVGMTAYLIGGNFGGTLTDMINTFSVEFDLPENHIMIVESTDDNFFKLLPNVTIGVQGVYIGNENGKGEPVESAVYKNDEWTTI